MSADFHAERLSGVGGSDIASVFSVGYGCRRRLWYQKRQQPPDYPRENQRMMDLGAALEPFFLRCYAEETGRVVVRHPEVLRGPSPEFLVHVDAVVYRGVPPSPDSDAGEPGVLEIKSLGCAAFYQARRDGLAEDYILQVQHALLCTSYTWGAYCIGCRDTGEITHWDVDRDENLISLIREEVPVFWASVQGGAPEALPADDKRCRRCEYRRTCQGCEISTADGDMPEVPELVPLLDRYRTLDAKYVKVGDEWMSELDAEMDDVREHIREVLAGRDAVTVEGSKVYNRAQKGRESLDKKGLLKEFPGAARHFREGNPYRVLRVYLKGEKA